VDTAELGLQTALLNTCFEASGVDKEGSHEVFGSGSGWVHSVGELEQSNAVRYNIRNFISSIKK
jgi:hypothetical protein